MVCLNKLLAWTLAVELGLGQADLTPEQLQTVPLKELDPPYGVFKNRDYNRLKPGDPARPEVLVDLDGGGITVSSVAECAIECTKTLDCNAASWYGASPSWTDVRNCWLKQLEPACQLPADAERHSDERAFLIARPRECNNEPSIAPPRQSSQEAPSPDTDSSDGMVEPVDTGDERSADLDDSAAATDTGDSGEPGQFGTSGDSSDDVESPTSAEEPESQTQSDNDETINTPNEVQAVLGTRQMNSDVPTVTEIESGAGAILPHLSGALGVATVTAYLMLR